MRLQNRRGYFPFLKNDDYVGGSSVAGLIGGTLQAGAGSTVTLQSWLNPANLVPDLGADVTSPGALSAYTIPAGSLPLFAPVFGPGAFADSETEPFTAAGVTRCSRRARSPSPGPGS